MHDLGFINSVLLVLILLGSVSFTAYSLRAKKKLETLNKNLELQSIEHNSLIKNANCGIMHIDNVGRIKQLNTIYTKFLGIKINSLKEYFVFLDEEQIEIFINIIEKKKDANFEQTFYNAKAEEINLNIYISFLPKTYDMVVIATSREDKIKLEKALYRSKIFFNHSDLGHIILDNELNIIEVNDSLCSLLGYRADELILKNFSIFFKTDILYNSFVKNYLKNNSLNEISNIEYRFKKHNNSMFWVEIFGKKFKDGNRTYTILSIRDISVRVNSRNTIRKLNERVQEELEKLQEIIDVISMPIFIKDKDFNYIDCNRAFCDFLKLSKEEIIGKNVFGIFSPNQAKQFHDKDLEMLKNSLQIYKTTMKEQNITIEIHKKTLYKEGSFNGLVGIILDITQKENEKVYLEERVKEELEKNRLQREQHQQEQLENVKFFTIGQMAAGITHEINTPLTYIKGNFEMLIEDIERLEESALKESMLEDTKVIKDGIERVAKIIESMREVSQKNSEKKEIVNILETVVSSLIISHNRAKQITKIELNGKTFDFNYTIEEEFFAFVQKQRLEQVWIIIINNALDELIKLENFENRALHISVKPLNNKIIIQFKDNAGGINEKILSHIFEPFESTKESSGIGIGLNIAKRIVEDQSGKITAYNQDNGAIFEVTLPLKEIDDVSK